MLVTGGGTLLGDAIAMALLAEGVEVTLLVRPGAEDRLGTLAQRTRWWSADVWDPASLKGRARGHTSVIHTVGSMVADPKTGLSHHQLNFVSARNVANMCVSDGAPHLVLMSSARAPWLSEKYIGAKREAETYLTRVGLRRTIIRAPLVYVRGQRRSPLYLFISLLRFVPPLNWLLFNRIAPLAVDVMARGVARITLEERPTKTIFYASDLRRRNTRAELRQTLPVARGTTPSVPQTPASRHPFELLDEDTPFGWTPPRDDDDLRR